MTLTNCAYLVAALLVASWPAIVKFVGTAKTWPIFHPAAKPKSAVVYEASLHALAICRSRIASTDLLDEKAKAAIDTLTLALVAGSDL